MSTLDRQAEVAWMSRGLCHMSQLDFFSDDPAERERAKAICAKCPVRQPCEQYARVHHEVGVWGGTDEFDRDMFRGTSRCLTCGGPTVRISDSSETCLLCHSTWYVAP